MNDSEILYPNANASEDDKRLFVTFSLEPRLDQKATADAGMNKYKDVEFITIRIPGDKTTSVHRPVMPADKHRFPLQYAAFKNNRGEEVVGTPLSLWPGIRPAQVKELEYFNVRTVEQLAAMPDSSTGASMMGINALRNAAKQYVQSAKEQAPLLKVQKELKERDDQIAALTDALSKQGALLERLIAKDDVAAKPAKGK